MRKIAAITTLTLLCAITVFAQQMPSGYKSRQVQNYIDSVKKVSAITSERYYYDKEDNGILELKLKNGVTDKKVFENRVHKNYVQIIVGTPFYTITQKKADEAEFKMEQRRKDAAFAEIEKGIIQIATEHQYDYPAAGIPANYRNPNIKKVVCDGYANAVVEKFKNHPLVASVEKWISVIGKHAWNVIVLKDGRKIYADATWYQGNYIDEEGYVADYPFNPNKIDPTSLTFDINEFNSNGGGVIILFSNEEKNLLGLATKKLKVLDKAVDKMGEMTKAGTPLKVHFSWEDSERTIPPPDPSTKKATAQPSASGTMYCVVYLAYNATACTEFKNTAADKSTCDTQSKGLAYMGGKTVWTATKPTNVRCAPPNTK